jgi:hypothetical protein
MRIAVSAIAIMASLTALDAGAQAPPARVRGVIEAFEGQTVVIATENDGVVRLTLTAMTGINGVEKRSLADITDNAFIGTTAVKDEDGRWRATEVHIFPESMRGAGEGHYAWDLPDSTMTNGAVTGSAAQRRGRTLTVGYAGGTTQVDVTRRTAIVALTLGDRTLLEPGATVFALAAPQQGGGAVAVAIIAETNGVKPPM